MAERKHPKRSEESEDRRMTIVLLVLFGERSRAEMAAAMGVSRSSLTRYMSGGHTPTLKTFQQIVAALGLASHTEEILRHVRALRCLIFGRALPPEYPEGTGGAELGTALGILLRDVWLDR
jgi:transcriptional regulator with XRE-family HTH domain